MTPNPVSDPITSDTSHFTSSRRQPHLVGVPGVFLLINLETWSSDRFYVDNLIFMGINPMVCSDMLKY